jgi:hypothetical protein
VLVGSGDDVGRAADQGRERLRAALEVADLDVEALLLEVAELLGERQRQIVERRRPADAELDVLFLRRLRVSALAASATAAATAIDFQSFMSISLGPAGVSDPKQ